MSVGITRGISMAISLNDVYKNFREYIVNNLNYELDETFKLQNKEEMCDDDKISFNWFKDIKIYKSEYTSFNEKVILFNYNPNKIPEGMEINNGSYILFSSYENKNFRGNVSGFAKEVDLDLGMFIHLFSKLEYAPLVNLDLPQDIIEDILDAEIHTFDRVKKLFSNITVFKVDSKYLNDKYEVEGYSDWIYRFLGILKCENKIENIKKELYFSKDCIEEYINVFSEDIKYFPYENLYLSLNHNSPKHIFLDVYRIIEKLYPIIFCAKIKREMSIAGISLFDVHKKLKSELNWNHKESEAIRELFLYAKDIGIENISILDDFKESLDSQYKDMRLDNWVYQIRNTSVHLSFDDEKNIDIDKCLKDDVVIKNLIPIISNLYKSIFI
ncbi:hypothetical protein PN398_06825 [Romboutsia sp. 1001216sp1]|uniref:hypothetical protein n=1 Tax=Romboutsia sp. 1001216sp1 TaxID=2986997 RepID=UPI00232D40C6|nr:hypothetical protein [Romboutsia sp. 1001216sp1]MDB8790428.1 hypothetical protein [Romboutsia sp. 1001216sp1]